jgi:two-component system sensor histidine kinase/response regulator
VSTNDAVAMRATCGAPERQERLRACTLLLVDDEEANLDLLEALLGEAGYARLVRTTDPLEVMDLSAAHAPDLVLLDLHMPHRNGLDVLADLCAATPQGEYRPVLVLTADVTSEARERALALGARDFVTKPFDATEVLLRVENLLDARVLHVDERRARERAEMAEAQAALLAHERERLLAVVAHDLRNPLGAIAMYSEMLTSLQPDDGAGDPYTRGALESIHSSATAMQRLVEDLLDAGSLRGGVLRLHRTERRVAAAFEEAERILRPLADAGGVRLTFDAAPDAATMVATVDEQRIVQLLSNIVGNAIKFTPPGGEVRVRYAVDADAVTASISDTGTGISPDDMPHLFAAFWRGNGAQHRSDDARRGVGLGLWIAQSIVEAHGGTLRVESAPEKGTTFHFVLPFASARVRWED